MFARAIDSAMLGGETGRSPSGAEVAFERELRLARREEPIAHDDRVDGRALRDARRRRIARSGVRPAAVPAAQAAKQRGQEDRAPIQKLLVPLSDCAMPCSDGPIRMIRSGGTQNIIVPTVSFVGSTFAFSSARMTRLSRISAA